MPGQAAPGRPGVRQVGFTLIEVVVAFVLLALVFSVGFEIFSSGLQRAGSLDERSRALEVARSQLAAAGMDAPLKEGTSQGDSDDPRFHWTTIVTPYDPRTDPAQAQPTTNYVLYRVETRVDWRGADQKDHALALATVDMGTKQ
jgi:general secretion pathway protein I